MAINLKKIIGWILAIVAVLIIIGQSQLLSSVLNFGYDFSMFHITVEAVVLVIAAYYLIFK